jgi:ribosome-associated protein
MPQSEPLQPDKESKSQRKEDMLALQKIGESLIKLNESQLEKINLPENLLTAILEAKKLTSNEAKRRQLQYVGKIMREIDPGPIKLALKQMQLVRKKTTAQFHQTEAWRDKLIAEGDEALNSFLCDHQEGDRQQLRQLIRKAQHDRKNDKNTGGEKALFQYLRALLKE